MKSQDVPSEILSFFAHFSLRFNFISIDYDLRESFIIIENDCFSKGKGMDRKDILGNVIKSECVGCAIVRGEIQLPGGVIYDGKSMHTPGIIKLMKML